MNGQQALHTLARASCSIPGAGKCHISALAAARTLLHTREKHHAAAEIGFFSFLFFWKSSQARTRLI
jgi:hypothetical protein